MEVKSIYRYARISAFKARDVARAIQGEPAILALRRLEYYPKKAARLIYQTLKSAIANAENNHNLLPETLYIREATIGEGPSFKRYQPKARGSAGPIIKRTSHIRIVLTDQPPVTKPSASKSKKSTKKTESSDTSN
ncbi:MAG: 50S ribosomal protein L22 [Methylacidiphilales bacterium]|nr:50S ribosomal protein L22 [Candidatus Methylacidiphilales bacterium]MDW8348983.1 50S ribosomal protein L22 [Verrucomicrobiae bacterium]